PRRLPYTTLYRSHWHHHRERHGLKIAERVIGKRLEEVRRRGDHAAVADQDRVAVGRGLGGKIGRNRAACPGAGSTIAADLTAKSAPDGYTVLISDSSVITTAPHLFKSLPYDPFRDLQAVSLAVVVPMRSVERRVGEASG